MVGLLEQRHVVAARGGDPRRLQAGRSAPDDHDLLLRRCRLHRPDPELALPTDGRVLHAVDRPPAHHVAEAALVRSGAQPDRLRLSFLRLVHPLRIRDQGPHERDRVGFTPLEHALCLGRAQDALHRENRCVVHRLLHRGRGVHRALVRCVVGLHHPDPGDADADVEEVGQVALLEHPPELSPLFERDCTGRGTFLVAHQPDPDRDVEALQPLARLLNDLRGEPGPVLEASAVFVRAEVVPPGEELREEITVRGLDLDAVESAPGRVQRAAGEVVGHLADVGLVHRFRRLVERGHSRRRPRRYLRRRSVVHGAGMVQLDERLRTVFVHERGERGEVRDRLLGPRRRVVRHLVRGARMHRGLPHDDRADAALRPVGHVLAHAFAVEAGFAVAGIRFREHREVRAHQHPVAEFDRTDREWAEKVGIVHVHLSSTGSYRSAKCGRCAVTPPST